MWGGRTPPGAIVVRSSASSMSGTAVGTPAPMRRLSTPIGSGGGVASWAAALPMRRPTASATASALAPPMTARRVGLDGESAGFWSMVGFLLSYPCRLGRSELSDEPVHGEIQAHRTD